MKEFDKVTVINDKTRYLNEGIKAGRVGYIIHEKRDGAWLVQFFNDDMSDSVIIPVSEEDLELCGDI